MQIAGIKINGISVTREYGHYLLQKNGIKMRCDFGELNECIPEFEEYLEEKEQERQLA
ncbi:hypothetical protein [Enterocloster bolteae]|uniref:hypothetical protein n=1 Tax=Enterocloster bolteae TaxID=208479 RepID=UPI0034A0D683